jgi:hypothetical protein
MTAALKQVADQLTGINGAERVKGAERFEGAAGELTGAAGELEAERIKAKVRAQLTNRPAGRGPLRSQPDEKVSQKPLKSPLAAIVYRTFTSYFITVFSVLFQDQP